MAEIRKAHCNNCLGERNHEVLHAETSHWSQDDEEGYSIVDGGSEYRMLKCCGCENITLQRQHWFSEDTDYQGRPIIHEEYYPPATYRNDPEWLYVIDDSYIQGILQEIYTCLRSSTRRVAAMGIRACLEHVMVNEVGDQGSFLKNMNKFQEEGYISRIQRENLDLIIEAGHATMHRSFHPSVAQTNVLVDITESILESIYINSNKAKALKNKIPARKNA